jgi:hypothetical protein
MPSETLPYLVSNNESFALIVLTKSLLNFIQVNFQFIFKVFLKFGLKKTKIFMFMHGKTRCQTGVSWPWELAVIGNVKLPLLFVEKTDLVKSLDITKSP